MKLESFPGRLERKKVEQPYITKTGLTRMMRTTRYVLTNEQADWLRRFYPEIENPRLMKVSGMTHATLHRFARELGLSKSERGIHRIKKRQAAHIKRVCERNGYYDSLRGHLPSAECRAGTAMMWQEIREGKREHPLVKMRRENPRRYNQRKKRIAASRRELIRKERMRLAYGLERKTRLTIVVGCRYTRSQTAHRHNAMKRGYFYMEDCSEASGERYNIYYDHDTRRSALFERNLIKDGFKVIAWEDDT